MIVKAFECSERLCGRSVILISQRIYISGIEVGIWMNTITSYRPKGGRDVEDGLERANELNVFFNRLNRVAPVQRPLTSVGDCPGHSPTAPLTPPPPCLCEGQIPPLQTFSHPPTPHFMTKPGETTSLPSPPGPLVPRTVDQVRNQVRPLNSGEDVGPDGVGCISQLYEVVHCLFTVSIRLQRFSMVRKASCLVPVPKTPHTSSLKDYKPVVLSTSITSGGLCIVRFRTNFSLLPMIILIMDRIYSVLFNILKEFTLFIHTGDTKLHV